MPLSLIEPDFLIYLRERWLEDHPHLLHASESGSGSGSDSEEDGYVRGPDGRENSAGSATRVAAADDCDDVEIG